MALSGPEIHPDVGWHIAGFPGMGLKGGGGIAENENGRESVIGTSERRCQGGTVNVRLWHVCIYISFMPLKVLEGYKERWVRAVGVGV